MARRILNRRELREQGDQAEQRQAAEAVPAVPAKAPGSTKAAAPRAPRPSRAKKKERPRLCARWGVFDASMKQVDIFDYNQHAAASARVDALTAQKKGVYFLQIVKEPMAEPAPAEPAGV